MRPSIQRVLLDIGSVEGPLPSLDRTWLQPRFFVLRKVNDRFANSIEAVCEQEEFCFVEAASRDGKAALLADDFEIFDSASWLARGQRHNRHFCLLARTMLGIVYLLTPRWHELRH